MSDGPWRMRRDCGTGMRNHHDQVRFHLCRGLEYGIGWRAALPLTVDMDGQIRRQECQEFVLDFINRSLETVDRGCLWLR